MAASLRFVDSVFIGGVAIPGAMVGMTEVARFHEHLVCGIVVCVGQHRSDPAQRKSAIAPDVATAKRWIRGWWERDRDLILQETAAEDAARPPHRGAGWTNADAATIWRALGNESIWEGNPGAGRS